MGTYQEKLTRWIELANGTPTRNDVREAGKLLSKGDVLYNRWNEHGIESGMRELVVVADVRGTPFFILEDNSGKTTWMRTRTLLKRYKLHPSGPRR